MDLLAVSTIQGSFETGGSFLHGSHLTKLIIVSEMNLK